MVILDLSDLQARARAVLGSGGADAPALAVVAALTGRGQAAQAASGLPRSRIGTHAGGFVATLLTIGELDRLLAAPYVWGVSLSSSLPAGG